VNATDRLLVAIRALVAAEFPTLTYAGIYEYTVQSATATSIDAAPADTSIGLPAISGARLKSGVLAEGCVAVVGATCLVEFVNADPTRPVVVSVGSIVDGTIDATADLEFGPSAAIVALGAAESPVARVGDACVLYFDGSTLVLTGTITTPPSTPYGTFIGTLAIVGPCPGIVNVGSGRSFA
jgi:hypothetical protein